MTTSAYEGNFYLRQTEGNLETCTCELTDGIVARLQENTSIMTFIVTSPQCSGSEDETHVAEQIQIRQTLK